MKYKANPVIVDAWKILSFGTVPPENGGLYAQVDQAQGERQTSIAELTPEMLARYTPVVGDYLVRQEDGYIYVNPRDVFERKYSPLEATGRDGIVIGEDGGLCGNPVAIEEFRTFCGSRPSLLGAD